MSRESPEQRRRRRRSKPVPVDEVDHRDAALRAVERKRRQAEREARELGGSVSRTYPLEGLGWLGAIFTGASLVLLLVLGAPSVWSCLFVVLSGIFAAVLLFVAHRHREARFGVPLRGGSGNSTATNVAIFLAVVQLAGGTVGLAKEIDARDSVGSTTTTIIKQKVCPPNPHFEFPYERS
jgi:FtsH-binding integral membrane protein